MDHDWLVEVKDDKGAAVTGATVALVEESALSGLEWPFSSVKGTHKHQADGAYKADPPIVPSAGKWFLIVSLSKKSPVVQPLKMAVGKGGIQTQASPGTAQTVVLTTETKKIGKSQAKIDRFKVTLFPSAEVVCISGTEYESAGTQFRIFAENYAIGLRREGKIDAGTIVTIFVADGRSRDTFVPGFGGKLLRVARKLFGDPSAISPGKRHDPVIGEDVSITDFYQYLSSVGASEPGRVKRAAILSHAWVGGPILYNTGDDSSVPGRIPDDFDGRRKDFSATNVKGWPNLKKAFAADGSFHLFGCSATTEYKDLTRAALANKAKGEEETFPVTTTLADHHGATIATIEQRTTRKAVRHLMDQNFKGMSYTAAAAEFFNFPAFGPPPGVGASFADAKIASHPKISVMFIDVASYSGVYKYFSEEFGPEFDPTNTAFDRGYVDYNKIRKRADAASQGFKSDMYRFEISFRGSETMLTLATGHQLKAARTDLRLVVTAQTGFLATKRNGHLHTLRDKKSAIAAFFVDSGQSAFRVNLDPKGKPESLGAQL